MIALPNITSRNRQEFLDWIELVGIDAESGLTSQEDIADVIHDAGWLPSPGTDGFPEDDEMADTGGDPRDEAVAFAADVWTDFANRAHRLGEQYPFVVDGEVLRRKTDSWKECVSFTALSLLACITRYPDTYHVPEFAGATYQRLFEKVVQAASRTLLGGTSVRFGVPREDDWPTSIHERIARLGDELGLHVEDLTGKVYPTDADRGLDIASRMAFGMEGPASVILITQCATGKHWKEKKGEPSYTDWQDILRWDSRLIRTVAIPFWIQDSNTFVQIHRRFDGAVVLDRARILAGVPDAGLDVAHKVKLEGWCAAQLAALPRLN
ncbi:MAG: hypothetical protein ABJC24_00095 [Chloroflexota bacterium]